MVLHFQLKTECWNQNWHKNYSPLYAYEHKNSDKEFQDHIDRAMKANLKYPILIDKEVGYLSDSVHRLLKAYILGHETIKAIVFDKLPKKAIIKKE